MTPLPPPSADLPDSGAAPLDSQKPAASSGSRGVLRALVKLIVLILMLAAGYYCYQVSLRLSAGVLKIVW